ncbi:hypothetical protein PBAL39_24630 [Pedobacter sp. BAL39]|nr:hypothetical protein PBAL39_24630 [Pedobacter sp. BAL39]
MLIDFFTYGKQEIHDEASGIHLVNPVMFRFGKHKHKRNSLKWIMIEN